MTFHRVMFQTCSTVTSILGGLYYTNMWEVETDPSPNHHIILYSGRKCKWQCVHTNDIYIVSLKNNKLCIWTRPLTFSKVGRVKRNAPINSNKASHNKFKVILFNRSHRQPSCCCQMNLYWLNYPRCEPSPTVENILHLRMCANLSNRH